MLWLDDQALLRHQRRNTLQSIAILAAIALWMGLVGYAFAGSDGVILGIMGTAAVLLLEPMQSVRLFQYLFGAVRLAPSQAPRLYEIVGELARRAGLDRTPTILYIPSPGLSAMSTEAGGEPVVALSDGMIQAMSPRELTGVLAHEISHLRHRDVRLLRLAEASGRLTAVMSFIGLVLAAAYLPAAALAGQMTEVPFLPILLLMFAPLVSDLMMLSLSRTREFAADAGAAELTGDPEGLAKALMRLERLHAGANWELGRRGGPLRWLRWIRTHPTTEERVRRLAELAPRRPRPVLVIPETLFNPEITIRRGLPPWMLPPWLR